MDSDGVGYMGHAGMYVQTEDGKYAFFEVNALDANGNPENNNIEGTKVLSQDDLFFPTVSSAQAAGKSTRAGVIRRDFDTKDDLLKYLKTAGINSGYDVIIEFSTTRKQDSVILNSAIKRGNSFSDYNVLGNSCGTWARDTLLADNSGIHSLNVLGFISGLAGIYGKLAPNGIGANLFISNMFMAKAKRIQK